MILYYILGVVDSWIHNYDARLHTHTHEPDESIRVGRQGREGGPSSSGGISWPSEGEWPELGALRAH